MTGKIRLDVRPEGLTFSFEDEDRLSAELDALHARYEAGQMKPARYVSALREFVQRHPAFIAAHADLGQALLDQDKPRQALEAALRGFQIGEKALPQDYRGPIEWRVPANRPFLSAADLVARVHAALGEFGEATQVMEKIAAWNPRDEQGVALRVGSLYLRAGETQKARAALESAQARHAAAHYDLGLLRFIAGDFASAATALRRGFVATPYIAELLCGAVSLEPISASRNEPQDDIEDAFDYADEAFDHWMKTAGAIPFLRWLYHHPRAMAERAAIFDLRERRLWEKNLAARDRLEQSEEELTRSVDDALSAEIVTQRETLDGRVVWPWLHWPAAERDED